MFGGSGDHAVRWDPSGRVTVLQASVGGRAAVLDASESGFAVGTVSVPGGSHAVRWSPTGVGVLLQVPAGTRYARASRVNESGMMFGETDDRVALWNSAGRLVPLEMPPDVHSTRAVDLNELGATAGLTPTGATYRSLRWNRHGRLTAFSPPGIQISDLDNHGDAVGKQTTTPYRAVRWDRSGQLRHLSGPDFTHALSINDRGAIRGMHLSPTGYRPIAWNRSGRLYPLELPPAFTAYPAALNQRGVSIGVASAPGPGPT